MEKLTNTLRILLMQAGILVFSLVFFGCGLESFVYLEPPTECHVSNYSASDPQDWYFCFMTTENQKDSNDYFQGTEVFYKIYNNLNTMLSAESSIDSLNSGTDVSAAANNIVNSRGYKSLGRSTGSSTPFVKKGNGPYVYIRLQDIDNEKNVDENSPFKRIITFGSRTSSSYDSEDSNFRNYGVPRRSLNDSKYGFNFNKDDEDNNPLPVEGDEDYNHSSTSDENGFYYIDMYAVSMGNDQSFTTSYSKVLFLGSVKIDPSTYNK